MAALCNEEQVLDAARLAGCLILENGGETFRAEETVMRICAAGGYPESEVIALPTGIFLTLSAGGVSYKSRINRIQKRSIDLMCIERVNAVSRALSSGQIDFGEAAEKLRALERRNAGRADVFLRCLYAAAATALFTAVYGGGIFNCSVAFVCGGAVQLLSASFSKINIYPFALSLIGSIFIAGAAVASVALSGKGNIDMIITGGITPLLPGLAMTNAIRDTIMGDLVSGSARFTEALLSAVGIASGVGLVLGLYAGFGGAL